MVDDIDTDKNIPKPVQKHSLANFISARKAGINLDDKRAPSLPVIEQEQADIM